MTEPITLKVWEGIHEYSIALTSDYSFLVTLDEHKLKVFDIYMNAERYVLNQLHK